VLTLIGGLGSVFALPLPWAQELRTAEDPASQSWGGWAMNGVSDLDGHRPLSLGVVVLFLAGSVVLAGLAWAAFEAAGRWVAYASAGLALVLLILSFVLVRHVPGTFGNGHIMQLGFGIEVWRLAVGTALVGAARHGVLREQDGD
jgi:hypothetical protein